MKVCYFWKMKIFNFVALETPHLKYAPLFSHSVATLLYHSSNRLTLLIEKWSLSHRKGTMTHVISCAADHIRVSWPRFICEISCTVTKLRTRTRINIQDLRLAFAKPFRCWSLGFAQGQHQCFSFLDGIFSYIIIKVEVSRLSGDLPVD